MAQTVSEKVKEIRQFKEITDFSEKETELFIVLPLLRLLGWNVDIQQEIRPQFALAKGKVDFALHNGKQCMIFVEVKKPSVDIDDHEDQLRDYCHQHPVDLAVLTNGLVWRLFQPTYHGMGETLSFKQKRFNEIDLTVRKPSAIQRQLQTYLDKEKVANGGSAAAAKKELDERLQREAIDQGMVQTWNSIVRTPQSHLVEMIIDVSPAKHKPNETQVTSFLQNHLSSFVLVEGAGRKVAKGHQVNWAFQDEQRVSKNAKQALIEFCELIYARHARAFSDILKVRGKKQQPYFSQQQGDLKGPREVGGTGYYAECGLPPKTLMQNCVDVAIQFGYDKKDFKVAQTEV